MKRGGGGIAVRTELRFLYCGLFGVFAIVVEHMSESLRIPTVYNCVKLVDSKSAKRSY